MSVFRKFNSHFAGKKKEFGLPEEIYDNACVSLASSSLNENLRENNRYVSLFSFFLSSGNIVMRRENRNSAIQVIQVRQRKQQQQQQQQLATAV